MDQVGSSLLELRYANEVIRQHLHEWLRFSRHLEERGLLLPATGTDSVRAVRGPAHGEGAPVLPRSRASVRMFLEADERGQFRRRVGSPPNPPWRLGFPDLTAVFAVCAIASRTGDENRPAVHPKVVGVRPVLGGRRASRKSGRITPHHVREFYSRMPKMMHL